MREIKFRAYNHRINQMEKVNSIEWLLNEDTDKYEPDVITREALCSDKLSLMQYTGLLDKNGKEIFEGDIVRGREIKYNNVTDEYDLVIDYTSEVKFVRCAFCIQLYKDVRTWYELSTYFNEGEYIEVIGNVYQNKDLLQ